MYIHQTYCISVQQNLLQANIELINEQVRLFYSALDEVKIEYNKQSFIITEYVFLRIKDEFDFYPLEKTVIHFKENGKHDIVSELLFKPPRFNKKELHHREGQHIRSHLKLPICHLVNKKIDGRTAAEYLHDNIDKIKLYQKEYRRDNDVYYKQYMQRWLSEHPDYQKNYRNKIKENLRTVV